MEIVKQQFIQLGQKTTVCFLVFSDGWEIVGMSSCKDANVFSPTVGESIAYKDAIRKYEKLKEAL